MAPRQQSTSRRLDAGASPGFRPRDRAAAAAVGPLVAKVARFMRLTKAEVGALADLFDGEAMLDAHEAVTHEGHAPAMVLVTQGVICRLRVGPDGRRQILDLLLPGDLCDQHLVLAAASDHAVIALATARVAYLSKRRFLRMLCEQPRLSAALRWIALQDDAMLRERIVALGRRDAAQRVAYLLCELLWRFEALGLAHDGIVEETITQSTVADALGLSPVHVSRIVSRFRAQGVADLRRTRLQVLDLGRLQAIAWLTPGYLHYEGPSAAALGLIERWQDDAGPIAVRSAP